ncbi:MULTISPECIES: site-specific integrase [unclassified Luteibacter]|uniref:site-specific integrase n=1 Tax=Luteibacter sp. PvP019 TaxID=3156436 RepID=UPI0033910B6C
MPKPLFVQRPSGLHVRFLVPVHAREVWGARVVMKSLGGRRGDAARLAAARLGYALSVFFDDLKLMGKALRSELFVKVQRDAQGRRIRRRITEHPGKFIHANYQVEERLDGSWVIIAEGPEDHENAMDMVRLLRSIPPDPAFVRTRLAPPPVTGPMLEQRVELFLEQFNQKQRAEANKLDTAFTMRLFVGIIGDKALASVGAEDMDRWLDALAHWPPNATKREPYKDLSPREVVIVSKRKGETPISLRTREKHLDRLRVFFNWAMERRDVDRNPCASIHVMTREQEDTQSRRAFTAAELATIFNPALREVHCDTPARWWLPLLALYSGGRAQELAQLNTQDIEEVSGIWGFHIAARFPGQKLKNRQSRRFVPLHPALLDAGLLTYRDDIVGTLGEGQLFPGLGAKPGDAIGDWFNRTYLRNQCHIQGQVYHCFRHSFITAADRAGIPEARIARLTGHGQGGSVLRGHYIDVPTLAERAAALSAVKFPVPSVPTYITGKFNAFLARIARIKRRQGAVQARARRQKSSA